MPRYDIPNEICKSSGNECYKSLDELIDYLEGSYAHIIKTRVIQNKGIEITYQDSYLGIRDKGKWMAYLCDECDKYHVGVRPES